MIIALAISITRAMMMQWKKDTKQALEYLQKANEIDPTCEAVYENLGILHLQS